MADDHTPDFEYRRKILAEKEANSEHPDIVTLAHYLDDDLSIEEDQQIQEHLSYCRRCNETLISLREPIDEETQRDPAPQSNRQIHLMWGSLAAVLLAGLFFVWTSRPEIGPARADKPLYMRVQPETVRSGVTEIQFQPDHTSLFVNLGYAEPKAYTYYYLELQSADGRITRFEDAQQEPGPRFVRAIPREMLRRGVHNLKLMGRNDGEETVVLTEWRFEVL